MGGVESTIERERGSLTTGKPDFKDDHTFLFTVATVKPLHRSVQTTSW